MTIVKKQIVAASLFILFGFFQLAIMTPAQPVRADETLFNQQVGMNDVGQLYGNQKQDLRVIIAKFISIALSFLAVVFVVLILFAGFQYMTSGGNEEKVKKAVALLKNAVIGLIIILVAWAVTRFIIIMLSRAVNNAVDYTHYGNGGPY